jgi:hypothetical protein
MHEKHIVEKQLDDKLQSQGKRVMAVRLRFDIAPADRGIAEAAAHWCGQFHEGIVAEVDRDCVVLASASHSEATLEAAWWSALWNERTVVDQHSFRSSILERLAQ